MTDREPDSFTEALRDLRRALSDANARFVESLIPLRRWVYAAGLAFPLIWWREYSQHPDSVWDMSVALSVYVVAWALSCYMLHVFAKRERGR